MLIGRLDRRITIYQRNFQQDVYGGQEIRGVTSTVTAWARIEFKDGSSKFDADAFVTNEPVRMIIRYINSADYGDYIIRSVQEMGRKEGLILLCDNKNVAGILD